MYSKLEMQQLKREFWIAFAEEHPRKWLLYDTKIKDFDFKFHADNKKAQVLIDIGMKDHGKRTAYFEKLESLKGILEEDYIADLVFEKDCTLETGKIINRVLIEKTGISLGNRNDWDTIFDFFAEKMDAFERFFYEFEDYIKAI